MNLQEFKSPLPKPWLIINADTIHARSVEAEVVEIDDLVVDNVEAKQVTLIDQSSVPNPSIGSHVLYSDLSGRLTTNDSLGNAISYVPVTGATMTGDIDMGSHSITGINILSGIPANNGLDLSVNAKTSILGSAQLNDTMNVNGQTLGNSGQIYPQFDNLVDLGFEAAVRGYRDAVVRRNLVGTTTTRAVDDIISCATNGVSGNVVTFTGTAKVAQDSGTALSSLATTAALANYLLLAGGTMTGALLMGANRIDSAVGLSIGTTDATSVSIGRSAVTTTINGNFTATEPYASWASTATYNPAFSAGVGRLVPPTTSAAGNLSEFTYSAGVLTYTGTVPLRTVTVTFNVSYTSGASGANMTFFLSYNGNTTPGNYRQFIQTTPSNNATGLSMSLTQNVTVTTGDTIQLGAMCATLSAAVAFNYVSCSVRGAAN